VSTTSAIAEAQHLQHLAAHQISEKNKRGCLEGKWNQLTKGWWTRTFCRAWIIW